MRLWSVHPRYLDRQGLTAAWREGLLAQKVLTGTTRGYRNHPQLRRFRVSDLEPLGEPSYPGTPIVTYLHTLVDEAEARGYTFDRSKVLGPPDLSLRLDVTDGQVAHEWQHLRAKLVVRSPEVAQRWAEVSIPSVNPLFVVVPGPVADWEVVTDAGGARAGSGAGA